MWSAATQRRVNLRNKRNAACRRPSRQKVTDADILRVQRQLELEGVKHHNRCPQAWRRLLVDIDGGISLRGFRKRWNLLGLNKKRA